MKIKQSLTKAILFIVLSLILAGGISVSSTTVNAKKYYSMKSLGLSNRNGIPFEGTSHYEFKILSGNNIKYRVCDTTYGSDYPEIGKWKKARLTSSTKYYKGDFNRFVKIISNKISNNNSFKTYNIKYISKTNKSKFIKYYKKNKYDGSIGVDMKIKNGKVKKLVYDHQVAG